MSSSLLDTPLVPAAAAPLSSLVAPPPLWRAAALPAAAGKLLTRFDCLVGVLKRPEEKINY